MSAAAARQTLSTLRRFAYPEPAVERCELCASPLREPHEHLLEPNTRQLLCACADCGVLFRAELAAKYRRVRPCATPLRDVQLDEEQWTALDVPVRLVFLVPSVVHERVFALYPNAIGFTEGVIPKLAWRALVNAYPMLERIEPEVQGLLVDGLSDRCQCYQLSIDTCHRVVRLIRGKHGRGMALSRELERALGALDGGHA